MANRLRGGALAVLAAGVALLSSPNTAEASGITLGKFGGIYGHANAEGGLGIFWNPARLSMREGLFLTLDSTFINRSASYDRVISTDNPYYESPGVQETNTGLATTSTAAILPMMSLGQTIERNRLNWGWALGFHPAYGGSSSWDKVLDAPTEYPGALDGPQRWSGITSSFVILHGVLATGVTLPDLGLSIGGSLVFVDGSMDTTRARNVNRGEALISDRGALEEGRVYFNGHDTAWTGTLGASYTTDTWDISAHYRGGYNLHIYGDLYELFGTADEALVNAFLDFPTPHTLLVASTHHFGDVELTGTLDFSTWSRMRNNDIFIDNLQDDLLLRIPRNLKNTLSARLIAGYNFNETTNASIMAGFDPSAVPNNSMDAALSDAPKVQLGAGLRTQIGDNLHVLTSYSYDIYATVTTTESLHEPTTNGTYNDSRHWLNLSLEGRF